MLISFTIYAIGFWVTALFSLFLLAVSGEMEYGIGGLIFVCGVSALVWPLFWGMALADWAKGRMTDREN